MQAKPLDLPINSIHNLHHNAKHNLVEIERLSMSQAALLDACEKILGVINDSDGLSLDMKSLRIGGNLIYGVYEQIGNRLSHPLNERLAAYANAKAGR